MFYDFYKNKHNSGQVTKLGAMNLGRYQQKLRHIMSTYQYLPALVLEIGPGLGWFARECKSAEYSYLCIDVNQGILRELSKEDYRTICGFVPPLPIRSESVEVVVADQVIEHMISFREASELLADCHRALKVDGFLMLGFPDFIRMGVAFYDCDYSHSFVTTENRIDQILRDTGFEPVKLTRFCGSVSNPLLRVVLDLVMLVVNARATCIAADAMGAKGFLQRIRKSFVSTSVIIARKVKI
jgi:SAM-dependent methyltransferase